MQDQRAIGESAGHDALRLSRAQLFGLLGISLVAVSFLVAFRHSSILAPDRSRNQREVDERLQRAATLALADRSGTVIVMDPQTGRIRAIVNPEIAFEKTFPLGSAVKPFTTVAAFKAGIIDDDTRAVCHEKYSHHAFQTTCSHPRDLPPLNPTEAIAYSCNYYFSTVGEKLPESTFRNTLNEFGFGSKTGVNDDQEASGEIERGDWRPQNAIGEGSYLQATPLQVIDAYAALVNGGQLFTPNRTESTSFTATLRSTIEIEQHERDLIVKGMRGAVRYGSAEKANLYSLPLYVFGKTGTATELNGFRTHGWFAGFAAVAPESSNSGTDAPQNIKLAVLVFLTRGHGFEAAQVSRSVFSEFARSADGQSAVEPEQTNGVSNSQRVESDVPAPQREPGIVRVQIGSAKTMRELAFEDYVRGVVAAEGSLETEPEALKALAIAVRTFALKNLGRHARDGYDFCTSTHCERFREIDSDANAFVSPAIIKAVTASRGQILVDEHNETAESYFSASCGGATANLTKLWGESAPAYLRGVRDDYCVHEEHSRWTDEIPAAKLARALQSDQRTNVGEHVASVSVLRTDSTGRAELIAIDGNRHVVVKGWDFKIIVGRALGWNILKSSRFSIEHKGPDFVFRGSGFGHGLGLCQEGAHVMALRGATYQQILNKYFPTTRVTNIETPSGFADDLIWAATSTPIVSRLPATRPATARQTLRSEHFRVSYPATTNRREVESLMRQLEVDRSSILTRVANAGISVQLPALEVYLNETTGDFVGRTGQPAWAAAATKGTRVELQPLATLKQRGILETTVRHELVHTVVDIVGHGRVARWLAEGLALHLAGEGKMISRYQPRISLSTTEIEKRLTGSSINQSPDDMRAAYAAAYSEVKRLINLEGESAVWRRVASGS
jgi:stage II sporulation protein D